MFRQKSRQSFTLIELLVVLAIVAILSTVVIMTLNPAELLKQARDSTRLSDLSTLNTALAAYNADVTNGFMGTSSYVYVSIPDTSSVCANLGLPALPSGWFYNCVTATSTRLTNGKGWIPVNLANISFGSPLSALPIDPVNTTSSGNYYIYVSGGSYELASNVESAKQKSLTGVAGTDGGFSLSSYETGSNLRLIPSGLLEWNRNPSLVAYWNFDEGSGVTTTDYSGKGNNGAWSGSGAHYVAGGVGSYAGQFNGTDDYVDAGSIDYSALDSLTISLWVKLPVSAIADHHIALGNASNNTTDGFSLSYYQPNATFYLYHGSTSAGVNIPNFNQWFYVVGVISKGVSIRTYTNGVLDYDNATVSYSFNSGSHTFLGKSPTGSYINVSMDDVRIYNRALSAAEISALYNATK